MSGSSIAVEIAAALAGLPAEVGTGTFSATIIVPTGSSETPWDAPEADPTEYEVAGLISEYRPSMIDGTLIQRGDIRLLIPATVIEPETRYSVRIGAKVYSIVSVLVTAPAGQALMYELQLRR